MKNRKNWLFLGLLLAAIGLSAGCGSEANEGTKDGAVTKEEDEAAEDTNKNSIGEFTTVDIYGETVTQEIFADYDLTLVNLFATWCGPCISEMPHLAQLQKDMQDKGVNVVAVVLDSVSGTEVNQETVGLAQQIAELAEAEFTFMIPDETNMNGRLDGIAAVPESFFVDRDGNIVGETYVGARDYDTWMEIVEQELAAVLGAE